MVVDELAEANRVISDSIQTISAISQQVASHTNATYGECIENENTIEHLNEKTESLQELAKRLSQ